MALIRTLNLRVRGATLSHQVGAPALAVMYAVQTKFSTFHAGDRRGDDDAATALRQAHHSLQRHRKR